MRFRLAVRLLLTLAACIPLHATSVGRSTWFPAFFYSFTSVSYISGAEFFRVPESGSGQRADQQCPGWAERLLPGARGRVQHAGAGR